MSFIKNIKVKKIKKTSIHNKSGGNSRSSDSCDITHEKQYAYIYTIQCIGINQYNIYIKPYIKNIYLYKKIC